MNILKTIYYIYCGIVGLGVLMLTLTFELDIYTLLTGVMIVLSIYLIEKA